MKTRHAAALALVGWYLMTPPVNFPSSDEPVDSAPLAQWYRWHSFDAASECERFRISKQNHYWAIVLKAQPHSNLQNAARDFHNAMIDGKCIASDDPRLKKK
jgi:hypothetical protein